MRTAIIGCGAFGYALGVLLARTHPHLRVSAFDVDGETVRHLREERRHPYFHTDVVAPENLVVSSESRECLEGAELVILAVPAQIMRKAVRGLSLPKEAVLLNIAKALEDGTNRRMSEVIREECGDSCTVATLSGGMIAKDAVSGAPVGAEIACEDKHVLSRLRELFLPTTIHVETTTDLKGVEYGGAFKNVIAIGAGIIDGLEWGASTKAFFVARSLREIEELSVALGAHHETFHTASNFWMGDLMTTCFGHSRNRLFGELLGRGLSRNEAVETLQRERKHAEGLVTLKLVRDLIEQHGIDAPFLSILHRIVYLGEAPRPAFERLAQLQAETDA